MTILDGNERDELCDIVQSFKNRPVDDLVMFLETHKALTRESIQGHGGGGHSRSNIKKKQAKGLKKDISISDDSSDSYDM